MSSSPLATLIALSLFVMSLIGCQATAIGDACENNINCDQQAGAICDLSVPEGYCTVQDCIPNGCPDESVCVEFDRESSYCMGVCLLDEDCREGLVCRRDKGEFGDLKYGFCYVPLKQ